MARAKRDRGHGAVKVASIDHFKGINAVGGDVVRRRHTGSRIALPTWREREAMQMMQILAKGNPSMGIAHSFDARPHTENDRRAKVSKKLEAWSLLDLA